MNLAIDLFEFCAAVSASVEWPGGHWLQWDHASAHGWITMLLHPPVPIRMQL